MTISKIMDQENVGRAVTRIAHEILEKNGGINDLCIVGIRTRGVALAERVNACIKQCIFYTVKGFQTVCNGLSAF